MELISAVSKQGVAHCGGGGCGGETLIVAIVLLLLLLPLILLLLFWLLAVPVPARAGGCGIVVDGVGREGGVVIGVFSRGRRGGDGRVGLLGLAGEGRYRDMGFVVHCGYAQVRYAVLVEDEVLGVKSSDFGEGVNGWLEGVRDVMKSITIEITSLYWRFLFFFLLLPTLRYSSVPMLSLLDTISILHSNPLSLFPFHPL